jgi:hypothetical protein
LTAVGHSIALVGNVSSPEEARVMELIAIGYGANSFAFGGAGGFPLLPAPNALLWLTKLRLYGEVYFITDTAEHFAAGAAIGAHCFYADKFYSDLIAGEYLEEQEDV